MLAGKAGDRKSSTIDLYHALARLSLPEEAFIPMSFSPETLFDEYDVESGGLPDKLWIVDDANIVLTDWEKNVNGERRTGSDKPSGNPSASRPVARTSQPLQAGSSR
jgi:hypothetical protein